MIDNNLTDFNNRLIDGCVDWWAQSKPLDENERRKVTRVASVIINTLSKVGGAVIEGCLNYARTSYYYKKTPAAANVNLLVYIVAELAVGLFDQLGKLVYSQMRQAIGSQEEINCIVQKADKVATTLDRKYSRLANIRPLVETKKVPVEEWTMEEFIREMAINTIKGTPKGILYTCLRVSIFDYMKVCYLPPSFSLVPALIGFVILASIPLINSSRKDAGKGSEFASGLDSLPIANLDGIKGAESGSESESELGSGSESELGSGPESDLTSFPNLGE